MTVVQEFRNRLETAQKIGRWQKIDLHNHTPASFDYSGSVDTAVEDTAKQINDSDLAIVMFTDHGCLPKKEFVDAVQKRTSALILRGVELNVFADAFDKPSGKIGKEAFFHLLVGFDPSNEYDAEFWLQTLYRECGKEERNIGGHNVVGIPNDLQRIIDTLEPANALLIPAHLHSRADAFRSRSIDDIYADPLFLSFVPCFDALEVTDRRTATFFDGRHAETNNLEISCIQSSDAHEAGRLGARPTWALMQSPSFEELRAALSMRSRISLEPPSIPKAYIAGIHVDGSYLKDLWLTLSPHCNVFIGIKGSGKTAALECLRFVLGVAVPQNSSQHVDAHLTHILGSTGRVRCLVHREDGSDLVVERSMADRLHFKVTFEDGRTEVFGQVHALGFPAQILGWHEIEHAATDPSVRRKYLDGIAGPEAVASIEGQIKVDAEQIKYLHEQTASRYQTYRLLNDQVLRKEELRRGLQELHDAQLIELRDQYDAAIAHRDEMRRLTHLVETAKNTLMNRAEDLLPFSRPVLPGSSPIEGHAAAARVSIERLLSSVDSFRDDLAKDLISVGADLAGINSSTDAAFTSFSETYSRSVGQLTDEQRRLLDSHRQVLDQTRDLPTLIAQRDEASKIVETQLRALIQLCDKISAAILERSELRRSKLNEFSNALAGSGLLLGLIPAENDNPYGDYSTKYKDGFSVVREVEVSFATAGTFHARLKKAYEQLLHKLANGFSLFFTNSEFSYFLTSVGNDDLSIEFDPMGAGSGHRPINQLSAGQRCTAMFPLLLKLKQGPLVIDQPEDNLDNRHIAQRVSPTIATDKAVRQIIMTSHNANLLVLSDPENVVVFEGFGDRGQVVEQGFLATRQSPVTQHVLDILDGGERALEMRYAKYGKSMS